jgi:hypothetical protein
MTYWFPIVVMMLLLLAIALLHIQILHVLHRLPQARSLMATQPSLTPFSHPRPKGH